MLRRGLRIEKEQRVPTRMGKGKKFSSSDPEEDETTREKRRKWKIMK
jgi:hypothetical protein